MEKGLNTLFIGQHHIRLNEVDSTNNYTTELTRQNGINEGTVVSSNYQTLGKGQRNKFWFSDKSQNLLLTIAIKPSFLNIDNQFVVSKIAALSVKRVLNSFGIGEATIKWPNDVMIGDSKVAGILIENSMKSNKIEWAIIGIGLNVNQLHFPEFHPAAISMKTATGRQFAIDEVRTALLNTFENYYLQVRNGNLENINYQYEKSLYLKGQKSVFSLNNKISKELTILKVDDSGKLVCSDSKAQLSTYNFHEISLAKTDETIRQKAY